MTALRPIAACLATICVLVLTIGGSAAKASPSPMVDEINMVRTAHGLHSLRYSRSLARSSRRYARYLAGTNQFQHAPRIRASSRFTRLGEILARMPGWEPHRVETLDNWLASPSHRAVLLSPSFTYVGAGRALSGSGEDVVAVWTVQFGR